MQPNNLAKEIRKLLPGTDCTGHGGCGFASCDKCAEAIAKGGSVNLCPACTDEDIIAIAALTGGEAPAEGLRFLRRGREERFPGRRMYVWVRRLRLLRGCLHLRCAHH